MVSHLSGTSAFTQHVDLLPGIDITANRLFGPQPRTSTYICIWEISLGHVKAILSAAESRILAAAGNTFRLNFMDMANSPASEFALPVDPDGKYPSKITTSSSNMGVGQNQLLSSNFRWKLSM